MAAKKAAKQRAPMSFEDKLELIEAMLVTARSLVETLETGETVETDADADHALEEAGDLARLILRDAEAQDDGC